MGGTFEITSLRGQNRMMSRTSGVTDFLWEPVKEEKAEYVGVDANR